MKNRDLRLLLAALLLLCVPLAYYLWSSRSTQQRREATLAGVPQFPAPHQAPRRKPFPVGAPAAPKEVRPPPPPPQVAVKQDPMTSFVLAPGPGAALIHVNALFNTPLYDRLRECMPEQFRGLDNSRQWLGVDIAQDVDRVALSPEGEAISGFFEGKPVAEKMIGPGADREEYRGATIFSKNGHCAAQNGNLVVSSGQQQGGDCRALIDRALTPAPAGAADELYGDVFMRSDLAGFRVADAPPEFRALVDGLDGITLRANVWDSVALTLQADPGQGTDRGGSGGVPDARGSGEGVDRRRQAPARPRAAGAGSLRSLSLSVRSPRRGEVAATGRSGASLRAPREP